ncbi:shikimate dehydrogenase [Noviherbaspirillum denitrificans]|uniref:Shikimate dehydrogenase (NADP(+)) n=1 Tax=Noviherbaspirillum denitrificans TaxID=1968433 RepID=A0A254TCK7_9BURK|nr:shikimate dehydrogenase [Noviherbaspirillum denitrificans]OWW19032.1 shikimate dehydrogenase [Noviherbaspirillum denitrificans]
MNTAPDRYVVIGNPIAHSKSPEIHARFAAQTGQRLVYDRLLAPVDGFSQAVRDFIREGGKGANVTVPFKLDAHALATELTPRAKAAGAVNTLKFDADAILGDNTDGVGMVTDIVTNAGVAMRGKRVLLLGAGGAARGVILPILDEQPSELVIANRTESKAAELASLFAGHGDIAASNFEMLQGQFDIVINATSASLADDLPPIPASTIGAFAYDMMYGKEPTVFMHFASTHGAAVRDGLGMLVEQAAEAFFVWRGVRPDTAPVYAELRAAL